MKVRYLVAAVAAAFAGVASAQQTPQVSFYGVLDGFVEYNTGGESGSRLAVQSGGVAGSRLGIRATQDLGGGLRALGRVEAGLGSDTGTSTQGGRVYGRQAWAGFAGGFGQVTLGRQYTHHFLLADSTDPFGTGYGSAFNTGVVTTVSRVDNSVAYESPNFSGFKFAAIVGAGETQGETGKNVINVGGDFTAGPLFVGLSVLQDKRFPGTLTAGDTEKVTATLLGATYSLGAAKLYGGIGRAEQAIVGFNDLKRDEYQFGATFAVSPQTTLAAGMGTSKVKDVSGSRASVYSLGVTQSLAKNLNVYGIYSKHKNSDAVNFGPSGASSTDDYNVLDGQDPTGIAVGFTFRF